MYPNVKFYPKYLGYMHDYSLNIACRDGRYKMTINFNNGEIYVNPVGVVAGGWQPSPYPAIMNPSENHIISQTDIWENKFKENVYMFIGKKKKQKVINALPIELEKYSDKLMLYAQSVFKLVNDGVVNGLDNDDDDW